MKTKGILINALSVLLLTIFAITGCGGGAGGGGGGGGNSTTLVSISITPTNRNIPRGETEQFIAIGTFSNGTTAYLTASVTWSSSNPAVATISNTGLATATGTGSTTIMATYGTISANTTLTVRSVGADLIDISVTPASAKIARGETEQFKATGTYSDDTTGDLTTSVTWISSDTTVATISSTGLATATGAGTTTITATSEGIRGDATLTVVPIVAGAVSLPETGQSTTYATGDDGGRQKGVAWPSPRFTVTTDGYCVTDNLTGLMWVRTPDRTTRTWESALAYANGLSLCGFDDWRLPNVNEMESLPNAEQGNSAKWLNTQGFIDVHKVEDYQWTSTTLASSEFYAWSVVVWNGDVLPLPKNRELYAWPVRSGQAGIIQLPKTGQTTSYATEDDGGLQKGVAWPSKRFAVDGNCVTDNLTGLMWGQTPYFYWLTWDGALSYANDLEFCGYTDWRLPNRKEIRSLINYGEADPVSYLNAGGFSDVEKGYYWSSTTYASNTEVPIAWYMNIKDLGLYGNMSEDYKYQYYRVWPVRGGQ